MTLAAWQNQKLTVYHGTYAGALNNAVISISRCRPATDFGQGFYTTTHLHQAKEWANEKVRGMAARGKASSAAVYRFELDRDDLARLDTLGFVRAIRDFWSFVTPVGAVLRIMRATSLQPPTGKRAMTLSSVR